MSQQTYILEYKPVVGSPIEETIDNSLQLARVGECVVHFSFNGVDVMATAAQSGTELLARWESEIAVIREAFRNSPEGHKQKPEAA